MPPFHMHKLHELAKMSAFVDFYSVKGGTHNDSWEVPGVEYYRVSGVAPLFDT